MWIVILLGEKNEEVQRHVVGNTLKEAVDNMREELINVMNRVNAGFINKDFVYTEDDFMVTKEGNWEALRKKWMGRDDHPSLFAFEV